MTPTSESSSISVDAKYCSFLRLADILDQQSRRERLSQLFSLLFITNLQSVQVSAASYFEFHSIVLLFHYLHRFRILPSCSEQEGCEIGEDNEKEGQYCEI